jgi:hypothetical protein
MLVIWVVTYEYFITNEEGLYPFLFAIAFDSPVAERRRRRRRSHRSTSFHDWTLLPGNTRRQQQLAELVSEGIVRESDVSAAAANASHSNPEVEFWLRLRNPRLQQRDLFLTYEMIYGPLLKYVEAEEAKTWMWLILALLINVVCIQIELSLFQSIMDQEQHQERGDNGTSTAVLAHGLTRSLRGI